MTDTLPEVFTPGYMGFATEAEFMADFHATMRDSGLRKYAGTYAELVAKSKARKFREPASLVPSVVFPREGGDDIVINGQIKSASAPKSGNAGGYEGPKDLDYEKKFGKAPGTRSGRGIVRGMSPAQINFARFLLSVKDTSGMHLVKGWTLDPTQLGTISLRHAVPFIDALKACPEKQASHSDKKELHGSPRQIEWITKGLNGKPSLLTEKGILTESDITALFSEHGYSAKAVIDALMKISAKDVVKAEITKAEENEEYVPTKIIPGFYRDDEGTEWKVQFNKAGTGMYALRKVTNKKYEFESGAIRNLTPDMFVSLNPLNITLEQAKAYGRKTGSCYMCGRVLTKQSSIDEGIGPICAGKF